LLPEGPGPSGIIKELRRAGRAVTGLSRGEASDAKLRALGRDAAPRLASGAEGGFRIVEGA
jgi:hypothetical protein